MLARPRELGFYKLRAVIVAGRELALLVELVGNLVAAVGVARLAAVRQLLEGATAFNVVFVAGNRLARRVAGFRELELQFQSVCFILLTHNNI